MKPSLLRGAAAEWGVPVALARVLFWLPIAVTGALLAAPYAYERLGKEEQWLFRRGLELVLIEDGPVEWGQVLCLACAAVAAGGIAMRLLEARQHGQATVLAFLALGSFLVAGEELSWGQRILGLETPRWLADVNRQGELNAHNIANVKGLLSYPRILVSAWGILGFALIRRGPLQRALVEVPFCPAPPAFLSSSFGVMLVYDVAHVAGLVEPGFFFRLMRYDEWPELCFASGLGAFLLLAGRQLSNARTGKGVPPCATTSHWCSRRASPAPSSRGAPDSRAPTSGGS